VTRGEKITLPTRPALSQGNYQGAGKGPTVEWKSMIPYLHHRKLRLRMSVETANLVNCLRQSALPLERGGGIPSPSPLTYLAFFYPLLCIRYSVSPLLCDVLFISRRYEYFSPSYIPITTPRPCLSLSLSLSFFFLISLP